MILDGIVDAVEYVKWADARIARERVAERPGVRRVPRAVSGRRARSVCACRPRARSQRVELLFARCAGRRSRRPNATRRASSLRRPAGSIQADARTRRVARVAADLDAAARRRRSRLVTSARALQTRGLSPGHTRWRSSARTPRARVLAGLAGGDRHGSPDIKLWPRCMAGGCGRRVPPGGARRGPLLGPGTPDPEPDPAVGTRYDPRTAYGNARRLSVGSATPCCSPWTATATPATRIPAPASTGATRYLVELVTPPRGTVCKANGEPFASAPG